MTAQLQNAWQKVWVSRELGDDQFKVKVHVAVGVAR